MNREILFRGKRIDNGEKIVGTHLTLKEYLSDRKAVFTCDCGKETIQNLCYIEQGRIKSCGCDRYKRLSERNTKHGEHGTRLYRIWRGMINRCYNQNTKSFKDYGGRGIKICEEWCAFDNFKKWADSNNYSETLTIDRIDVNGNYEPTNCRWATMKQQCENKRERTSMPTRDSSTGRFIGNIHDKEVE